MSDKRVAFCFTRVRERAREREREKEREREVVCGKWVGHRSRKTEREWEIAGIG